MVWLPRWGCDGMITSSQKLLMARAGVPSGPATDPFFSDVSLLLHCDGSNGSTTFTDSSSNALTVTANGDAQIDTTTVKYGTGSAKFDGAGDSLTLADNALWAFGTGDFCVEMWFNFTSTSGAQQLISSYVAGFSIQYQSTWNIYLSGGTNVMSRSFTPNTGQWYHLALTRSGTDLRLFVDGSQQGATVTNSTNISSAELSIGKLGGYALQHFNGYLDDIRITKGQARYTANFTPPAAAFPDS